MNEEMQKEILNIFGLKPEDKVRGIQITIDSDGARAEVSRVMRDEETKQLVEVFKKYNMKEQELPDWMNDAKKLAYEIGREYTIKLQKEGIHGWEVMYFENRDYFAAGAMAIRGLFIAMCYTSFAVEKEDFALVVKSTGKQPFDFTGEYNKEKEAAFENLKKKITSKEEYRSMMSVRKDVEGETR